MPYDRLQLPEPHPSWSLLLRMCHALQFFGGMGGGGMGGDPFAGLFGGMGGGMGGGGGPFMQGMPGMGGMGGHSFGGPMGGPMGHQGPVKDKPITRHLNCTLEELFAGSLRKLKITRTIFGPSGQASRSEEEILEVNVKPGWKKGTKVTFPEKGRWSGLLFSGVWCAGSLCRCWVGAVLLHHALAQAGAPHA